MVELPFAPADRRGRRGRGVEIVPGNLRRARLQAGLSLVQLALAAGVSRQAISQFERGAARPSMPVLRAIALRLGRPLGQLMGGQVEGGGGGRSVYGALSRLERMLAHGDLEAAVEHAGRLLLDPGPADAQVVALTGLGQALVLLRRPEEALPHLTAAVALAEGLEDRWAVVEAQDWSGMAQFLLGDPACLPTLERALTEARSLEPVVMPTVARILSHLAAVHVARHAWRQAIGCYAAAAAAGEQIRDPAQVARMHDGLAQVYAALGQMERASACATKALALYELQADAAAAARAENNLGDLLLQQGDLEAAAERFQRSLEAFRRLGIERQGPGIVVANLAEVERRRGDPAAARRLALEALEIARRTRERVVEANARLVLAQVHEAQARRGNADREFRLALEALEALDMPDRLRDAHMVYAAALDERGDIEAAHAQWRAAAEAGRRAAQAPAT